VTAFPAFASPNDTADLANRLTTIRNDLPRFKQQLDGLKSKNQDISYPLATYTVLDNFTSYALEELNILAPNGWGMLSNNGAQAAAELVKDAHTGQWAIRISNRTPHQPNVYGMFQSSAIVSLKPGQVYTLSIWAKGNKPGFTSMTLNASWSDRLEIAGTAGQWKRFSKTFTPTSADVAFQPRLLTEDVGDPLLVDDICLVRGSEPEHGQNLIANGSFELSYNQQRVSREMGDMQTMAKRLQTELADATAGTLNLISVPRWDGSKRPHIEGPSFVGPVRVGDATVQRPIFFIGYGHFDQVRNDIDKFPGYGINIIQSAELGPSSVFPKEAEVDEAPIEQLSQMLDRAAKAHVAVDWLLSPHVVPEWWLAKYPGLRKQRADFFPFSIYSPHAKEMLTAFAHEVVAKIKDKPALLSICLSNEPINCELPDALSTADWQEWLKQRHKDIATLNAHWKTTYKSFDEIPQPNPLGSSPEPRPGAAWCDFCRWNSEYFAAFHKMLADAVHDVAPQIPVHIKATTWHFYRADEARAGDDATLFDSFTQINGNDSVNLWSFGDRGGDSMERGDKDFAQGWRENALAYELERSTHDAPVFNSENHLIFDGESRYVSPAHIRSALWMGAIHGQSATTLWVWERELSNPQSVFAGDIMDRASCAEAVGLVNLDLNRVAPQITALQNAPADVLILQSNTAAVWDGAHYNSALVKLFTPLSFTGLKPGFVTEDQLEQNKLPRARVIIVPQITHISDAAFASLARFQGKIIIAGLPNRDAFTRDEYDQPRARHLPASVVAANLTLPKTWQELTPLLEARLKDLGVTPPTRLTDANDKGQTQVQWQTAKTANGLIINLYNASHDPATVKLSHSLTLTDLLSGEKVPPGNTLTLKSLEVRLLICE
jgi:hypothetical protein